MHKKVTIIGGGSSTFVPQLMRLFIGSPYGARARFEKAKIPSPSNITPMLASDWVGRSKSR